MGLLDEHACDGHGEWPIKKVMKSNYTDQELQLLLAKMLPEQLLEADGVIYWKSGAEANPIKFGSNHAVRVSNTEWLHACWLVGLGMNAKEQYEYMLAEKTISNDWAWKLTWQQRAQALAKVKGLIQ